MRQSTAGAGHKFKSFLSRGGLFLLLIIGTFFIVFRHFDGKNLIKALNQTDPLYLLIGVFAMFLFISCEAFNLKRLLRIVGEKASAGEAYLYAFTGFFYSAVTPSASGGQPMQLLYMKQKEISISRGTLVLLLELCSFQIISILMGLSGLAFELEYMRKNLGNLRIVFIIGVGINIVVLIILLTVIFFPGVANCGIKLADRIFKVIKIKNRAGKMRALEESIRGYREGAVCIYKNKTAMVKTLVITFIQMTAMHSVPYWVYLAFGGSSLGMGSFNLLQVIGLQAVLFVSVSALPLPGAVGVSESAFVILFKTLFPASMMGSAMILSRGISFYAMVAFTGIFILISHVHLKKINRPDL